MMKYIMLERDPKEIGRKKNGDKSQRDHNRDSEDNIVKKIKAK